MTSQSLSPSLHSIQSPLPAQTPLVEGLYLQMVLDRSLPVMLPAPQLVEILTVAIGQIVPIFHLPPWVAGVYNWRGEVLWIVDLNHLLGLTPWYEQANYSSKHTVVVLRETSSSKEKAIVGLVVNRVEEVVECSAAQLHLLSGSKHESDFSDSLGSSLDFSSESLPVHFHQFFIGYWQNEIAPCHWLLNIAAILQKLSESSS